MKTGGWFPKPVSATPPTPSSSYCTALEHPNLDLLDVGHCLGTTSCRASPRHELHLRYLVSFRDVRHLSLFHNVYYQQSSRSSLWSASVSVLLVHLLELHLCRLDSLLDFPGCSAPGSDAVGCTVGVFTTPTKGRNLDLQRLHCSLLYSDCWNMFA